MEQVLMVLANTTMLHNFMDTTGIEYHVNSTPEVCVRMFWI